MDTDPRNLRLWPGDPAGDNASLPLYIALDSLDPTSGTTYRAATAAAAADRHIAVLRRSGPALDGIDRSIVDVLIYSVWDYRNAGPPAGRCRVDRFAGCVLRRSHPDSVYGESGFAVGALPTVYPTWSDAAVASVIKRRPLRAVHPIPLSFPPSTLAELREYLIDGTIWSYAPIPDHPGDGPVDIRYLPHFGGPVPTIPDSRSWDRERVLTGPDGGWTITDRTED